MVSADEQDDFELDEVSISETFGDETGDLEELDEATGSAIDVEFTEVKRPQSARPRPADDIDVIRAEPAASKPTEYDEFDAFLSEIPTDKEVTIIIKRKPDHGLKFRIPNAVISHVETRMWGRESLDVIYHELQRVHGGGRYWFQVRYGRGLGRSWDQTIMDPADHSERERTLLAEKTKDDEQQRRSEHSQAFVNPASAPAAPVDEEEQLERFMGPGWSAWQTLFDRMRPGAELRLRTSR
jgi:hypothetical protein